MGRSCKKFLYFSKFDVYGLFVPARWNIKKNKYEKNNILNTGPFVKELIFVKTQSMQICRDK